jgi:phosphatidylglycerophosphate synthase
VAFGTPGWIAVGVALLHLYEIFDCVDGELARLTRRFSTLGLFFESYSAYTMINGYYLATAYYVLRVYDAEWPLWLAVGVAAFGRNGAPVARRVVVEVLKREVTAPAAPTAPTAEAAATRGKSTLSRLRKIMVAVVPSYIDIRIALSSLVLADAWLDGGIRSLLLGGFVLSIVAQLVREAGALALYLFTDTIDRDLHSIRNPS